MNKGTMRSVGVFTVIALVLAVLVVGGIQLVKNRNAQFASHGAPAPTSENQGQPSPSPQTATPEPQPTTPQPSEQPQATSPQPVAAPSTDTTPQQVPATGPAEDIIFTGMLIVLAAYFGLVLKKAKMTPRRLLS